MRNNDIEVDNSLQVLSLAYQGYAWVSHSSKDISTSACGKSSKRRAHCNE